MLGAIEQERSPECRVVVVVRVVIVGIPGPLAVSWNRSSRNMDDPFGQRFGRLGVLHRAERSNPQVS